MAMLQQKNDMNEKDWGYIPGTLSKNLGLLCIILLIQYYHWRSQKFNWKGPKME